MNVAVAHRPQAHARERDINMLLARQHGVLTVAQLHECGCDSASICRRTSAYRLFRIAPGIYANVPWNALSEWGRETAAVLAVPGSAISHETAAFHWRIWPRHRACAPGTIDVVAPREHRRGLPGVRVHGSRHLDLDRDSCVHEGIVTTTVVRTIVDLGAVLTPWQLAHAWHEADFWLKPNRMAIHEVVSRMGTARNVSVVRAAEKLLATGSTGTHSALEDCVMTWLIHNKRKTPWVNRHVPMLDGGSLRVDFAWVREQLVIEVDGGGHDRHATALEDRWRTERLVSSNYQVVRLRPWHVRHLGAALLARIPPRRSRA